MLTTTRKFLFRNLANLLQSDSKVTCQHSCQGTGNEWIIQGCKETYYVGRTDNKWVYRYLESKKLYSKIPGIMLSVRYWKTSKKATHNVRTNTFFESCNIHISKEDWSSAFNLYASFPLLDASDKFCRHFLKCLMRSDIAPIIATEACCFTFCASCMVVLIISIWRIGFLATFLWSKCLTKLDNRRWELSPGVKKNTINYIEN